MTPEPPITESDLAELIARMDEAAKAYISGDLPRYVELFDHGDDYSLMPPYGGPTRHGFEYSEEAVAETKRFFASGEATLDVEQSYVSGDLAVLVAVERQHGEVGGLPDQTSPCASPSCSAARAIAGRSCTGTRTRWCDRSRSSTSHRSPAASTTRVRLSIRRRRERGFAPYLARRRCEGGTESRRVADNAARSDAKTRAAGVPN